MRGAAPDLVACEREYALGLDWRSPEGLKQPILELIGEVELLRAEADAMRVSAEAGRPIERHVVEAHRRRCLIAGVKHRVLEGAAAFHALYAEGARELEEGARARAEALVQARRILSFPAGGTGGGA